MDAVGVSWLAFFMTHFTKEGIGGGESLGLASLGPSPSAATWSKLNFDDVEGVPGLSVFPPWGNTHVKGWFDLVKGWFAPKRK